MKSPTPSRAGSTTTQYADRVLRSHLGVLAGIMLLGLGLWMVIDTIVHGTGRTQLLAAAAFVLAAPVVAAFTVRPAVYIGDQRMRVRNPFRTVSIPWGRFQTVKARYSTEVVTDQGKYQLWAVPVSMRSRKRADRHNIRTANAGQPGLLGRGRTSRWEAPRSDEPILATSDRAVEDLRSKARLHADDPAAQGQVSVRWAYELLAPAVVGAIALILLLTV